MKTTAHLKCSRECKIEPESNEIEKKTQKISDIVSLFKYNILNSIFSLDDINDFELKDV